MWVYKEEAGMDQREISYVPGFYKIFDEILVNAADNKQRDPSMDVIKIEISKERSISVGLARDGMKIVAETANTSPLHVQVRLVLAMSMQ